MPNNLTPRERAEQALADWEGEGLDDLLGAVTAAIEAAVAEQSKRADEAEADVARCREIAERDGADYSAVLAREAEATALLHGEREQHQREMEATLAREAALRAALGPFARWAKQLDSPPNWVPDGCPLVASPGDISDFSVGQLRAARAALSAPPQQDPRDAQIAALRRALESVMVGGNHLAAMLLSWLGASEERFPPFTASLEDARKAIDDTNLYDGWVCWRTIMLARAALSAPSPGLDAVRREAQIEALESVGCTCAISPKNPLFQSHFRWCPMGRAAELRKGVEARK